MPFTSFWASPHQNLPGLSLTRSSKHYFLRSTSKTTFGLWEGTNNNDNNYKNEMFESDFIMPFLSFHTSLKKCKTTLVVPPLFVALLKSICAKLVGANEIKPELLNATFWSGLPAKFRSRKKKVFLYIFI